MHWPNKPQYDFKEGNRARWRGRASNPVGDGIRSRAGSTPAAFRHFHGEVESQMPEGQRVLDDDVNPVDVIARLSGVGPMRHMGQLQ